jgi:hypothetical protein
LPVAFTSVAADDRPHMPRSLTILENWGLQPRVVVTDGSNLDPAVEVCGPESDHQLGAFT